MIIAIDTEYNENEELLVVSYKIYHSDKEEESVVITDNFFSTISYLVSLNYKFLGHNIKADVYIIYKNTGILLTNVTDTMILCQLLTNGTGYKVNLQAVLLDVLGITLDKEVRNEFIKWDSNIPIPQHLLDYSKKDVEYLFPLYQKLIKKILLYKLENAVKIENALIPVLVKMECMPVLVDIPKLEELEVYLSKEIKQVQKECFKELKLLEIPILVKSTEYKKTVTKIRYVDLNLSSPKQIVQIFQTLNLTLPKSKKGNESTDGKLLAKWLEGLEEEDKFIIPFATKLLEYKKLEKLYNSYIKVLLYRSKVTEDGYNYTNTIYKSCATVTHRLSSSSNGVDYKTNLQNIPSKGVLGKKFKQCFICKDNYVIASCDMSQAELRLAASFSQDKYLLGVFNEGIDVHVLIAQEVWNVIGTGDVVTKEYPIWNGTILREITKSLTYGLMYGAGASKVAELYGIPLDVAKKVVEKVYIKLEGLSKFLKSCINNGRKNGYLTANDVTNRRRYTRSPTELSNYKFQATNSDAMKLALIAIDKHITTNNLDAHIINTVHDSVFISIKEGLDTEWIKKIMANSLGAFLNGIEGNSDINIAKYWQ